MKPKSTTDLEPHDMPPRGRETLGLVFDSAPQKRYDATIIFVHHFGGSRRTTARHAKFVTQLGFDSVRFDLLYSDHAREKKLPITGDLQFGARHIWTEQISSVLNAIPGKKIVYSFSMSTNSAITAIANRRARDVVGLVCDGGPFLQLMQCTRNLLEHQYEVTSPWLRTLLTPAMMSIYGFGIESELERIWSRIPKDFPMFSIRGGRDPLVPPSAIDDFFEASVRPKEKSRHSYETLHLANGGHLDGLKNFSEEYRTEVARFLKGLTQL